MVRASHSSATSHEQTSTDRKIAQEAMEKYTVEKVCSPRVELQFALANNCTGDCSPHQAHGSSQHDPPPTTYTNSVQFDERKGATWHCIVGRNFGSFVTHGKANPGMAYMPA